jgi:hypothetical protein
VTDIIVSGEAAFVGPDDTLVIRLPASEDRDIDMFMETLRGTSLEGRVLVVITDGELAVVKGES